MIGNWEIAHVNEPQRFVLYARAYLDAASVLCEQLIAHEVQGTWALSATGTLMPVGTRDRASLNGGADFYEMNPKELRTEFKRSLQVFLEACAEKGIEPRHHFSGKFNLRISPDLHEKLAIAAQAQGKSINTLAQEALRECVAS